MQDPIFTVGHSNHPLDHFIALLQRHDIAAIADVRSKPYSRANPQFNRDELKEALTHTGIVYVFLGKELGARSEDAACYENGKVQGFELKHIHGDGEVETHSDAIGRLMRMLNLSQQDMFQSPEERVENAYKRQAQRIAYTTNYDEGNNADTALRNTASG
jgi:uncharacterized protein (DUF488 family)